MILRDKRVKITEEMLTRARVPRSYWRYQISGLQDGDLRDKLRDMVQQVPELLRTNEGLLILGPLCTGKTVFSAIMLREAMCYGAEALFLRAFEMMKWTDERYLEREPGRTLESKALMSDLVVLDDVGGEGEKQRARVVALMEYLVRYRYEEGRSTIVTTNLTLKEIKQFYGSTFESVLRRSCLKRLIIKTDQFTKGL